MNNELYIVIGVALVVGLIGHAIHWAYLLQRESTRYLKTSRVVHSYPAASGLKTARKTVN